MTSLSGSSNEREAKKPTHHRPTPSNGVSWNSPLLATVKKAQPVFPPAFRPVARLPIDITGKNRYSYGLLPPPTASQLGLDSRGRDITGGSEALNASSHHEDGLVFSDEAVEEEAAISSPIKAIAGRTNSKNIVSVTHVTKTPAPPSKPFATAASRAEDADVSIDLTVTPLPIVPRKRTTKSTTAAVWEAGENKCATRVGTSKSSLSRNSKVTIKTEVADNIVVGASINGLEIIEIGSDEDVGGKRRQGLEDDASETGSLVDSAPGKKKKVTNDDLPYKISNSPAWLGQFVPAIVQFAALQRDPWTLDDAMFLPFVQAAYNAIFLSTHGEYMVDSGDALHERSLMKLRDWRTRFGFTALSVIDSVFHNDMKKYKHHSERIAYCRGRRPQSPGASQYFYALIIYTNSITVKQYWKGLFASPVIIQTLAHHYTFSRGSVPDIPGYDGVLAGKPIGALGLVTAALERVYDYYIKQFIGVDKVNGRSKIIHPKSRSGRVDKTARAFSAANNLSATKSYSKSAKNNLTDEAFKSIRKEAIQVAAGSSYRKVTKVMDVQGDDSDDERADLCEGTAM
ncbi:hypothetical protein NEOLEDRAFT_1184863 [Neolentinus lepideus HHB14362 ss-1]|uniref:Uncharacterized protein n=1 Tax=Neolentinus lepideus HHB14362 ss-1 TaxID=1314782 RepID=A0A165LB85_9AGAM|nr:hypothetical protein NEOLEDRAFT_1184863 [Neolentinus lepideus HHB14362 ss-1]